MQTEHDKASLDAEPDTGEAPGLSVIVPAHNEAENLALLVDQIHAACSGLDLAFECVVVDDASTDTTAAVLASLKPDRAWLRSVKLLPPPQGGGNGQSAAFQAGIKGSFGTLIAMLDADLQNDPAELPRLIARLHEASADMVQGDRSDSRRAGDAWVRRFGSGVGRVFRRMILGDSIRDTGCSLRVMKRDVALALPLEYKGLHRFIPVTARQLGYRVIEEPVAHRARHAGTPKYGLGIASRAVPGLIDCFAVRWMGGRRRLTKYAVEHRENRGDE